jgi:hypothetical protein
MLVSDRNKTRAQNTRYAASTPQSRHKTIIEVLRNGGAAAERAGGGA